MQVPSVNLAHRMLYNTSFYFIMHLTEANLAALATNSNYANMHLPSVCSKYKVSSILPHLALCIKPEANLAALATNSRCPRIYANMHKKFMHICIKRRHIPTICSKQLHLVILFAKNAQVTRRA